MGWPSIREFLGVPGHLSGKGVNIAIVDGRFPNHPDISTSDERSVFRVKTSTPDALPQLMWAEQGPWVKGAHGLAATAAAAGSGELSGGRYSGVALRANLYLLETGPGDTEVTTCEALSWLKENWERYQIRGVVVTVIATRDTGLLPWQIDPVRVMCEQLADEGLLVVSAVGNSSELTCNGPASAPSVLSVGGIIVPLNGRGEDALEYHHCRGTTFEGKAVPEVLAPAENVVLPIAFASKAEQLDHMTAPHDRLPEGYARAEGTSYAAPIILGIAACLWENNPEWSGSEVKSLILNGSLSSWNYSPWPHHDSSLGREIYIAGTPGSSYSIWKALRGKTVSERLSWLCHADDQERFRVALSFLPGPVPLEAVKSIPKLLDSTRPNTRMVDLLLRAECGSSVDTPNLAQLLRDPSRSVRMAALYALAKCCDGDFWGELVNDLSELFSDDDSDVRYWALTLAANVGDPSLTGALISGLKDDAVCQRASTFGVRLRALEKITGQRFPFHPPWKEGQCPFSDRSTEIRLGLVKQWNDWWQGDGRFRVSPP